MQNQRVKMLMYLPSFLSSSGTGTTPRDSTLPTVSALRAVPLKPPYCNLSEPTSWLELTNAPFSTSG